MILMRKLFHLNLVLCCVIISGCAANSKLALEQAVMDFNAQRYGEAHQKAKAISERSSAPNRHDAAYIAGMSAYQLGQITEAEKQLQTAMSSPNVDTQARSQAVLGQIRLDQRRWRDAAVLLTQASESLTGEDRLKAAANASLAYQQLGDLDAARNWRSRAYGQSPSLVSPEAPIIRPSTTASGAAASGFTLQVGAFQEKKRAENAAREALRLAQREGWGQVRIVPKRDERGKPTYLVQIGTFPTREAAAAARARIGRLDYIVAVAHSKAS
jgi:tetratricopeptide (TPR) repeat protein